jgi:hypothetical protein
LIPKQLEISGDPEKPLHMIVSWVKPNPNIEG